MESLLKLHTEHILRSKATKRSSPSSMYISLWVSSMADANPMAANSPCSSQEGLRFKLGLDQIPHSLFVNRDLLALRHLCKFCWKPKLHRKSKYILLLCGWLRPVRNWWVISVVRRCSSDRCSFRINKLLSCLKYDNEVYFLCKKKLIINIFLCFVSLKSRSSGQFAVKTQPSPRANVSFSKPNFPDILFHCP